MDFIWILVWIYDLLMENYELRKRIYIVMNINYKWNLLGC